MTTRLALKGSDFGRRDVLLTLAGLPEARFSAEDARRWVDRFLSGCPPADGAGSPMWTSRLAESADRRLEAAFRARLANRSRPADRAPGEASEGVERLLGADPIVTLTCEPGRSGFLPYTAVVWECSRAWESVGMTVAVSARDDLGALRWTTLTGVEAFRPFARPDVLVVDQADRRPAAELRVLLDAAGAAKVVLVEGGTAIRLARPASAALGRLGEAVPGVRPGPAPAWGEPGAGVHPAGVMLGRWADSQSNGRPPPLLVGLGVPEVGALNDAARRHLANVGKLTGPELTVNGRGFRAGDAVVAVRPLGSGLPAGSLGRVAEVDIPGGSAVIRWPHRSMTADRAALARIGHGYAATPRLASRTGCEALVLGPDRAPGLVRSRVIETFSVRAVVGPLRSREGAVSYGPDTWPVHW